MPSAAALCTALFAAAASWLAVISRLPHHRGLSNCVRWPRCRAGRPPANNPAVSRGARFESSKDTLEFGLGRLVARRVVARGKSSRQESFRARSRRSRMLSHETRSRDADAASPASSAKARNANLDLRGDDRQDASRPRVAPDGAVPKARVGHHRDGQEQRKNTARDLRLAAVVGRPVASTHRRHGQSVSRPSLASGCPSPWKGCPHCASPAFTAGVVVRAARWSRAVSHGRAARSSKTASIAATRLRMPSWLRERGPEKNAHEFLAQRRATPREASATRPGYRKKPAIYSLA